MAGIQLCCGLHSVQARACFVCRVSCLLAVVVWRARVYLCLCCACVRQIIVRETFLARLSGLQFAYLCFRYVYRNVYLLANARASAPAWL